MNARRQYPLVFVSVVLMVATAANARAQSLALDFTPSILERIAREGGTFERLPVVADGVVATEGKAVELQIERSYARPGDRWIDAKVILHPQRGPLAQARVEVKLMALASSQPVETIDVVPPRASANLSIDLRSRQLERAQLSVELFEGGARTGVATAFLSAHPTAPVKPGTKIEIKLDVPAGAGALKGWPITFGVPFAEGALWHTDQLRLVNRAGREIPSQKEVTGRWSREGSIQWVRFDALATLEEGCLVEIAAPGPGSRPDQPLRVIEERGQVIVDTGAARYVLGRGASPIEEVTVGNRRVAVAAGTRGLYVVDQHGRLASASPDGEMMEIESRGPVSACVRFEGFYRTADGIQLARHITRVECSAGQPMARITHTLVLTNDSNDVWFKEIGWEFGVAPGASPAALFASSLAESGKYHRVPLTDGTTSAHLLQDSHYFFGHGKNHFKIAAMRSGVAGTEIEGEECGSWAAVIGESAGVQMFCRDAARQHPKEFEVFADRIVLKLYSNRAGEELDFRSPTLVKKWDLAGWTPLASRPSVKDPAKVDAWVQKVAGHKTNAIGWAKTHELMFSPLRPGDPAKEAARLGYLHQERVYPLADPQWIYRSKAMGPLYPKDVARFPQVEEAQSAAIHYWINRDRAWGENGFIDYHAGPHLSGVELPDGRFINSQFRYTATTYSLRGNLWRVYARSGDRAVRDFAAGSLGSELDNIYMHWEPPAGSALARGIYRREPEPFFGLPFYWGSRSNLANASSSNFNGYLHYYHLTGYRRARDCVEQFAEGVKKYWTPERAKRESRIIAFNRVLMQSYGLTWDPQVRDLIEATTDLFEDRAGALLLTKERPHGSTSYKTRVDVRAMIDAWRLLGTPRYHRLALTLAHHHWGNYLGSDGVGDYNDPSNFIGHFLHEETGKAVYAQALAVCVRNNIAGFDPKTGSFPRGQVSGAHVVTNIFEMDYALDVLARTNADKANVTSWMSYNDDGKYSAIYVRKPENEAAVLYFRREVQEGLKSSIRDELDYGATDTVRLGTPVNRKNESGQDVNSVWQTSMGNGKAVIPKDAPALDYPLLFPVHPEVWGSHQHVFATTRIPLVLHAPGTWLPAPLDYPPATWFPPRSATGGYSRKDRPVYTTFRYFFAVPAGSNRPQIYFEGSGRLYMPGGAAYQDGKPLSGWVDLPADRAGLWAFEGVVNKRVQVRNLPPFFAVGDPENHFVPDVPWEPTAKPPRAKNARAAKSNDDEP